MNCSHETTDSQAEARGEVHGLPAGFRYHDLRHYFASLLIASGADVKTVQARRVDRRQPEQRRNKISGPAVAGLVAPPPVLVAVPHFVPHVREPFEGEVS